MSWWVRVDDKWRDTDDLTLDELIAVEQACGEPWALLNPYRSALAAKALLAAFMVRDGAADQDAAKATAALTLKEIKNVFQHRDDDDLPDDWEDGLPVVDPKPVLVSGTG